MYVTSGNDTEIRQTLEAVVDIVNAIDDAEAEGCAVEPRPLLEAHNFSRAAIAPAAAIRRLEERIRELAPRVRSLAVAGPDDAVGWINAELAEIEIAPSLTEHDGDPLHVHWTPASARFDDQVIADVLMALTQELADTGTTRFGKCAASDCEHLFFDSTRNGSRRFCNDARCASRTHTADHRRRQQST
ncbi:MAG: CGNR zinc finger domain-containing protein [Acidimicrobiia bacterium]|nr:CGNR zinc finger domain-containing protein [Acidimicrobiia bacterium]